MLKVTKEYTMQQCYHCNGIIKGRADKKFCSKDCSNKYNFAKRKSSTPEVVKTINRILIKNRSILSNLFNSNKQTKKKLSKIILSQQGFDFQYCTGVYFNRERKMYHYIYDFAWMEFSDQEVLVIRKLK